MADVQTKTRVSFPSSELQPGQRRVITVGRREIITLNVDGKLYALFNRCPHQQAPFEHGLVGGLAVGVPEEFGKFEFRHDGEMLRCPWHKFAFDMNTGRCPADPDRLRVARYDIKEEGDEIAVYV